MADEPRVEHPAIPGRSRLFQDLGQPGVALLVSAAVGLLGSFLPWAAVLGLQVYGIQGDGLYTAAASGAYGAFLLLSRSGKRVVRRGALEGAIVVGLFLVIVAAVDWTQFASVGIWFVLLGGLGMVGAAGWALARGAWQR